MAYKFNISKNNQNLHIFETNTTSSKIDIDQIDSIASQVEIFSEPESNLPAAEVAGVGIELSLESLHESSFVYPTNLSLKKDVYSCKGAREELDEEFVEFNILNLNYKKFFDLHDRFFYTEFIPSGSHQYFLNESLKYVGNFVNPRLLEIEELNRDIERIQREIDSVERTHPFIPNGKIVALEQFKNNIASAIFQGTIYYMQSGKLRQIKDPTVYHGLKNRLTPGSTQENEVTDEDFIIFLDSLSSIPIGPEINVFSDIYEPPFNPGTEERDETNIILYINRYGGYSGDTESRPD